MESRRTPESIARQLRQEAGFGCCRCGYPIFEYHHIIPWHQYKHFDPNDMMTLCPNCHEEVTNARVSEKEQREWKTKPHNIMAGFATGLLRIDGDLPQIRCGQSLFTHVQSVLEVSGESLLSLRVAYDGRLLLSAKSYNRHDQLVFHIEDNVWITGDGHPWDLKASWLHITMRHKLRDIGFEVDARETPIAIRGTFWRNGFVVRITDTQIVAEDGIKAPIVFGKLNLSYARAAIFVN